MKIQKLWIEDYKNLHDFEIEFDTEGFVNVILGGNGTGKTTLIEALVQIFDHLENGLKPPFAYTISYICKESNVHIIAKPFETQSLDIQIKDLRLSLDDIQITSKEMTYLESLSNREESREERLKIQKAKEDNRRLILPSRVFGYYSGASDRLAQYFNKRKIAHKKSILRGDGLLQRFFFAQPFHGQLALLAFFIQEDSQSFTNQFLKQYLSITALDSVLLVLKEPLGWPFREDKDVFWSKGGAIYKLLRALYQNSQAPLRFLKLLDETKESSPKRQFLYRYLTKDALNEIAKLYSTQLEFFTALESLYSMNFIHDIRIQIRSDSRPNLSFQYGHLSEGEQQLLMVLGLLRFMKERESIFLLDEPDTHLNPQWGIKYMQMLNDIVGESTTSQVIMTTHNPLIINSLGARQIQIMDSTKQLLFARHPEESPIGQSVDSILTSDMFGLESSLDLTTQGKIQERRALAFKTEPLSQIERERLAQLNVDLQYIDSVLMIPDKIYQEYVRMIIQDLPIVTEPPLTQEQRDERRERLSKIFQEVKREVDNEIH